MVMIGSRGPDRRWEFQACCHGLSLSSSRVAILEPRDTTPAGLEQFDLTFSKSDEVHAAETIDGQMGRTARHGTARL